MNQQTADEDLLRRVRGSRESLALIASQAEKALDAMKKDFEAQLKEQERIVDAAEKLRNAYNRESLKWETGGNRSLPLGSTYQVETRMVKYRKNMATQLKIPYPWLATPPPPPPPPPAPKPKRKIRIINDDDSSDEEKDEVAVTGERSWAERDRALRAKAIALDSCVDEVFRNFNVSIR